MQKLGEGYVGTLCYVCNFSVSLTLVPKAKFKEDFNISLLLNPRIKPQSTSLHNADARHGVAAIN